MQPVFALWAWAACQPDPTPIDWRVRPHFTVAFWPHAPPLIAGGEVVIGSTSELVVEPTPVGAEVRLYLGYGGEGPGPCTLPGGLCADIVDPVLFDTVTADGSGIATFAIDGTRFDTPSAIAWQAVVIDPELDDIAAHTEAIVRHAAVPPEQAAARFEEVTLRAGLTHTFTSGNTHSGGVAFVDLNNDLWPDLYVSNGAGVGNYLYRNDGDGTFTELSPAVRKPDPLMECAGAKAADIDNDGDIDLIVAVDNPALMISSVAQDYDGGPNLLWRNEGGMHFTEVAAAAGLVDPEGRRTSSAAVADIDRDGCIDVYLTNWAMAALPAGDNYDRLLRGNCDGTFTDITAAVGADGRGRDGLVGFFWDADFDLYPELYVGNNSDHDDAPDFDPDDVLYRNVAGDLIEDTGSPVGEDAWAAMGIDIGDIDADGDWDLYITDVWELPPVPRGNVLYEGQPDGTLSANVCHEAGVCFGHNSWPTNFEDFDNDGWIDLWVGSSWPSTPDMLFINTADGTGRFEAHRQHGFSGHTARAGTTADYDGDGDMDIFLFDEGDLSSLWMNRRMDQGPTVPHYIELHLVGTASNRAAIGAVARLTAGGVPMMRRVTGGDSAHSHRMLTLHFGLGDESSVPEIEVTWPSGAITVLHDVAADRIWLVDEDEGLVPHQFDTLSATHDASTQRLTVFARSNYGGRARLEVAGLGPMTYDAATVSYTAVLATADPPDQVTVIPDLGDPMTVDVLEL